MLILQPLLPISNAGYKVMTISQFYTSWDEVFYSSQKRNFPHAQYFIIGQLPGRISVLSLMSVSVNGFQSII